LKFVLFTLFTSYLVSGLPNYQAGQCNVT